MDFQIYSLIVLILFSALFSAIETALVSLSRVKVNSLLSQNKRGSEALFRIKANPHRMIITILIGNNLVNIGASSIATVIATNIYGNIGAGIATGFMTFTILVFGEITPKSIAIQKAETISLFVAKPIELLGILFTPLIFILEKITGSLIKIFGVSSNKELSQEELQTMVILAVREGILTKDIARMMQNILKFSNKKVLDIMTPHTKIAMVNAQEKISESLPFIIKSPYSIYPAFDGSRNNVIGFLHKDDILEQIHKKRIDSKIAETIRPALFVPETKEIDELLKELSPKKTPMALVVDEFGGVVGLVTLEDILEEIVGNIFDKSIRPTAVIREIDKNTLVADAQATIEQLENKLNVGFSSEQFSTIAGFIQEKLGTMPKKGEELEFKNIKIIIEDVDKKRIKRIKIIKKHLPVS